ncbi:hypothetical protein FACS1894111_09970 [Clostridia bacterium]|nr:hypothetical protein FACS1894111_09970 [Clostridia bacterium]
MNTNSSYDNLYFQTMDTKIGILTLVADENALLEISFGNNIPKSKEKQNISVEEQGESSVVLENTLGQQGESSVVLENTLGQQGENSVVLENTLGQQREDSVVLENTVKQLNEYFNGKRKIFDLPLAPKGTEFQQRVWKVLTMIPYGETKAYSEVAALAGNPKASRAVGMANNKNPIAIVIPCHRVIGKNKTLVGYGGGLDKKEYLLKLESEND